MKKLGQHFLKNKSVLDVIIKSLNIKDGELIIEIGPGHGELTIPLLSAAATHDGSSIISIEKDHSLIDTLAAMQEQNGKERFEIKEGDALTLLPAIVSISAKKNRPYKIVGNIPYYITGKLLRVISELPIKPILTAVMIQKEVAERVCAMPPDMNRLAASVQYWADAEIITHVPKKDFTPPPEVDSAVILLTTKPNTAATRTKSADEELYYRAVRGIFAQPRKNLINNVFEMAQKEISKTEISSFLSKLGIDPESRPQNLTVEEISAISKIFS